MQQPTIDARRHAEILDHLRALEAEQNLQIVYACESGSRAWGFPSRDSDYDVRFLYLRPLSWYLAIHKRADVVDEVLEDDLDVGGWDLRKAFHLLGRGNAPLLEWLASPIVYRERTDVLEPLRRLASRAVLTESLCHHYLAQTRGLLRQIEAAETAKLKRYFYVMRALLSARWIVERDEAPPMNLWQLVEQTEPRFCTLRQLEDLASKKLQGDEATRIERRHELERAMQAEHDTLMERIPKNPPRLGADAFDEAFLATLRAAGILPEGLP